MGDRAPRRMTRRRSKLPPATSSGDLVICPTCAGGDDACPTCIGQGAVLLVEAPADFFEGNENGADEEWTMFWDEDYLG